MKVLLVAPQSKDTVLGTIGIYCSNALEKLGYETKVFDFRQSQYLRTPIGKVMKKIIKKIIPNPTGQIPLINSVEKEKTPP